MLPRHSIFVSAIILVFCTAFSFSTHGCLSPFPFGLLLVSEASAQSVSAAAKSKYDAGVAAMQRGDCQGAKALFKQAIALDPTDRSVRVGMFSTDYHPNANLKAAEAKCPSTPASPPAAVPAPTPSPPPTPAPAPTPSPPPAPAQPVVLTVQAPQGAGLTVQNETARTTVQGSVSGGEGGLRVSVNGKAVRVGGGGRFSTVVALNVGANDIAIQASDSKGKSAVKTVSVTRLAKEAPSPGSTQPPTPTIPAPPLELVVSAPTEAKQSVPYDTDSVEVRGTVKGGEGRGKIFINGKEVKLESNGSFVAPLRLRVGDNAINLKASDAKGASKVKQLTVTRLAAPPPPTAPIALNITAPQQAEQSVAFETDKVTVSGRVSGGKGTARVTVDDKVVACDKKGAFTTALPLTVGENRITVKARDAEGQEAAQEFLVVRAAKVYPPPSLTVTTPSETRQSVAFEVDKATIKGSVSGGEGISRVTVNDKEVKTSAGGAFTSVVPLDPGDNTITVKVRDAGGKEAATEVVITRLAKVYPPPSLTVTAPSETRQSVPFEIETVTVKGSISGGEGAPKITVRDREVKADASGTFSVVVPLDPGENTLVVKVRDAGGREASRELFITRLAKVFPPPTLSLTSPSEFTQSVPFETEKATIKGSISGGEGVSKVTVNDKEVKMETGGVFSTVVPLDPGENRITVKARDEGGREASRTVVVTRLAKVYPPPVLSMKTPAEARETVPFETEKLTVTGSLSGGAGGVNLTVNDKDIRPDSAGAFTFTIPLEIGDNRVAIKAIDSAGREDVKQFVVSRRHDEKRPPVLEVRTPTETGEDGKVAISGTAKGGKGDLKLIVDGRKVPLDDAGAFNTNVALRPGKNRILVRVEDSAGRYDSQVWFLFNYPASVK